MSSVTNNGWLFAARAHSKSAPLLRAQLINQQSINGISTRANIKSHSEVALLTNSARLLDKMKWESSSMKVGEFAVYSFARSL